MTESNLPSDQSEDNQSEKTSSLSQENQVSSDFSDAAETSKKLLVMTGLTFFVLIAGLYGVTQLNGSNAVSSEETGSTISGTGSDTQAEPTESALAEPSPAEINPYSQVKFVRGDGVKLRKSPSLSADVLVTTALNDQILASDETHSANGYSWTKVQSTSGETGWIVSDYLADELKNYDVEAIECAESEIYKRLKAPSTANFIKEDTQIIKRWHPKYLVEVVVDSQNSYGAMLRGRYAVCLAVGEKNNYYTNKFAVQELAYSEEAVTSSAAEICADWTPDIVKKLQPSTASRSQSTQAPNSTQVVTDHSAAVAQETVMTRAMQWKDAWANRELKAAEFMMHNDFNSEGLNKWSWLKKRQTEAAITLNRSIEWENVQVGIQDETAELSAVQHYSDFFHNGKSYRSTKQIKLTFVRWSDGNWYLKSLRYL